METATAATSQAQQQYRRLLVAAVMLTIGWPLCFAAVVIIVATINTQCWAVNPALHTYMSFGAQVVLRLPLLVLGAPWTSPLRSLMQNEFN